MKINKFIIDNVQNTLTLEFANNKLDDSPLSFEYLRISSPINSGKKNNPAQMTSHKKQVILTSIECVAKHGYRLIFDDDHQAIYSEDYLQTLVIEYDVRWQNYLTELANSGHSREATIEIKQL